MLNMTERSLYSLAAYFAIGVVVQAQQPDGYVGCFSDSQGKSLINSVRVYRNNNTNTGELCKNACKTNTKRFAGAKRLNCYCGEEGVNNTTLAATCNTPCPGNINELCGNQTTIIIYDTWKCITRPCSNESTCEDIDAENFRCNCKVGWTGSDFNAQTSTSPLAVYISVPLTVVIAVAAVITFLIIRKTRKQKKDDTNIIYKKPDKESHPFSAVANNAYNDQDIIQSDIHVYVNRTAKSEPNSENVGTTEESNYQYVKTDNSQSSGTNNQIPLDEYGYGHLKSMTTAVCDPTYSHTPNLKCDYNHDYTYSHAEKTTKSAENLKAVNDTYSHIDKSAGKLKAGVTGIATDDTYNKLNNHGTKVNQPDKHTQLVLNEP